MHQSLELRHAYQFVYEPLTLTRSSPFAHHRHTCCLGLYISRIGSRTYASDLQTVDCTKSYTCINLQAYTSHGHVVMVQSA